MRIGIHSKYITKTTDMTVFYIGMKIFLRTFKLISAILHKIKLFSRYAAVKEDPAYLTALPCGRYIRALYCRDHSVYNGHEEVVYI